MEGQPLHPMLPEGSNGSISSGRRRALPAPGYTDYIEINAPETDGELFDKFLHYWNIAVAHKVTLVLVTFGGVLAASAYSVYQTPTYVAATTLELNQLSQRQPFEGISFLDDWDPTLLQTQMQIITSRMLQDRVQAKLSSTVPSGGEPTTGLLGRLRDTLGLSSPAGAVAWQEAVGSARGGLTVTHVKDTRLVRITVVSTLPQAAAEYANTMADVFIDHNQEERWQLYQTAGEWFERARQELKTKLEESERQLLAYSSESGLVLTSKAENIAEQQLLELQTELSRALAARVEKEAVYRTATSESDKSLAAVNSDLMESYQIKIADLRRELADASTALMPAHPKVKRLEAQIAELVAAQTREQGNMVNKMRSEYESALNRERQIAGALSAQSKVLAAQDQKLIRYKMLQREVETYRELYDSTLQKGKEASVASALRPVNVRVIDGARPPRAPAKPNVPRNLLLGLVVGLGLGAGLVLIREQTDTSIRAPGSIPHKNLRELGVIPSAQADLELSIASGRSASRPLLAAGGSLTHSRNDSAGPVELATWNRKGSLLAESVRAALTSILMSTRNGRPNRVILITSPSPREGKSTVVTNLAIALAEINRRILLVDGDLRRSRLHTLFGQANTWGLSDFLREDRPCLDYPIEALARPTDVPGLFSLPAGLAGADVSRLLHSTRMSDLIDRLRSEFDAVLIDSPPVLAVADARVLSRFADAVVLVFRAGQTTRDAAASAVTLFEADGTPILGTILNDLNASVMGGHYYSSDYSGYSDESHT